MRIAVLMKDVPDLVEDLELDDESMLAVDDMTFVPSEWDDQALEEALLIKEDLGAGEVTVLAVDTGDVDNMLFTALAKGADKAVKIVGDFDRTLTNRQRSALFANVLNAGEYDVVLTGVQAVDDVDGQIAGLVAGQLKWPHASVVRDVTISNNGVNCIQEYAGGRMAELHLSSPALLGIQASRKPPRYVTIAKVRQTMKSVALEEVEADVPEVPKAVVRRLYKPESSGHAEMFDGDVEAVADQIIALLEDRKLLRS